MTSILRRALLVLAAAATLLAPAGVRGQEPAPATEGMPPQAREFTIKIDPLEKIPPEYIALPRPRLLKADPALERAAAELHQVLWDDLRYSGVFAMVDPELYGRVPATTPEKVPFEEWMAINARWLALIDVSAAAGEMIVEGRLFETRTDRKMVLGKRYQAKPEAARKVAHTFADLVIGQVGGEPGVCSTQILFVSDRDGGRDRHVYLCDYDGHAPRRLTGTRGLNISPDWSPDGQEVVYTSYARANPDLYVMSRSGSGNRALFAKPGMNSSPAWSPDGSLIAFASSFQGGDSEVYTIRPDGTGLKALTSNRGIDTNPAWSPAGREIAFSSDRSGRPDIWVMDADGLNPRRPLRQAGYFNDGAAWAPVGKPRLAFAGMTGGNFEIFVYRFEDGSTVQLTPSDGRSKEVPTWSPDGRQISFAMSTRQGRSDIYVMSEDGSNLRRITSGGSNLSPAWSPRPRTDSPERRSTR